MKILITFSLWMSLAIMADKSDDLFGENQEATSYVQSFQMDCSSSSPLCNEREEALKMEGIFNEVFASALSRNIHIWPGNELRNIEEALNLRKVGDDFFSRQFFGKASDGYKEAIKIVSETLDEADTTVNELIELGEQYLYEDGKPEWAAPYFNDAAPYDPENQRIIKGIARIRFLRSFEDDVANIENLLFAKDFEQALSLIEETLLGDPGNKTLEQLKIQGIEGTAAIKFNTLRAELNADNYSLSLEEKREKLTKIENSISLYGEKLGPDILESKLQLINEMYQEELDKLEGEFINNPNKIEITYQNSKRLMNNYPDKEKLQELFKQISETRNKLRLDELKISADEFMSSELWVKAKAVWQEIYVVDQSEQTKNKIQDLKKIIGLISKIEEIDDNSPDLLNNQSGIDSAKLVYEKLVIYSNESTPKLNKDLVNFDNLINQYQALVTEAKQNKKRKQASNKIAEKSKPKTNKNTSTRSDVKPGSNNSVKAQSKKKASSSRFSSELQNYRKASLDMNSFSAAVLCKKRIRNKKFVAQFEINLSSQGKPKSVFLTNRNEIDFESKNTKQVLAVVTSALMKSKYLPAKSNGIYIESVLTKKLVLPKGFCG